MGLLTALGATKDEDLAFRHLVTGVSATEDEIAVGTGLSPDDVRGALAGLIERGLASRTSDTPARFVAASPGVVETMLLERIGDLRAAQEALDGVADQYRINNMVRAAAGVFEIVRGGPALRQCMLTLIQSARFDIINLVKPPVIVIQPNERILPSEAVHGRLVFETEALEQPGSLAAVQQELRASDEVRVHTRLPIKMLVADRSAALLPLVQNDTTPVGVLVRESAILDAILALVEYVWAGAIPLHVDHENSPPPRASSVLSDDDRRLLSLLLAGLTDEAIAVHRGTSVRTVQRKVHALMVTAHVRTRMQLAWEAARQGWM